jgi:hypothetical protein
MNWTSIQYVLGVACIACALMIIATLFAPTYGSIAVTAFAFAGFAFVTYRVNFPPKNITKK